MVDVFALPVHILRCNNRNFTEEKDQVKHYFLQCNIILGVPLKTGSYDFFALAVNKAGLAKQGNWRVCGIMRLTLKIRL